MLQNATELMMYTIGVMGGLTGLGIGIGVIIAKVRERRFLKAFKDESDSGGC